MSRVRRLSIRILTLTFTIAGLAASFQNCAKGLPEDVATLPSVSLTGDSAERAGLSCKSILDSGLSKGSGPYWIDVDGAAGESTPVETYCEMDLDGGGWTLIAANSMTTTFTVFNKPWADYRNGFGGVSSLSGSGWIGLERMYLMTRTPRELKVATNVQSHYYVNFSLGNEAQNYALLVTGTATSFDNGLFASYHNGLPFTTGDRDNDTSATSNCAATYATGWWHGACYQMSIGGNNTGVVYWRGAAGAVENATSIHMWVR